MMQVKQLLLQGINHLHSAMIALSLSTPASTQLQFSQP